VRSCASLVALLMVATLALVAPAGCDCRLDLHHGEPLHPLFAHPHPDTPTETDGLAAAPSSHPQLHGAHVLDPGGPSAGAGQVLPRVTLPPEPFGAVIRLAGALVAEPRGLASAPPEPPPRLA
jgi:hypothetical protein